MLTNKITISDDLLNTVRGILGEAKKCPADCECEKCEAEEMKEGYASAAAWCRSAHGMRAPTQDR